MKNSASNYDVPIGGPGPGNFAVDPSCLTFLENVETVVHHFRSTADPVYWIRSEYTTTPVYIQRDRTDPGSFLSGTHTGRKPCCEQGSEGAEFSDRITGLIEEGNDKVITKTWFSAFKETNLFSDLVERGITDIFFGGLLTNVCVLATITDAIPLHFHVHAVEDCMGWRNRGNHNKAIGKMRELGAQVTSTICLIGGLGQAGADDTFDDNTDQPVLISHSNQGRIPMLYYVNGSIPSWRVMMALYEKGLQFDPKRLLVMSDPRETRLPQFLEINHRGKTPVFVDIIPADSSEAESSPGTSTINVNESLAILQYIETYHNPDIPLLPPISQRRQRALVLSRVQETENLHYAYDDLEDAHFSAANKTTEPLDVSHRAELIHAVHKELDFWEVYAGQTDFIAGNEFGLADCAFFPILAYMVHRGFEWRRPQHELTLGDHSSTANNKPRRTPKGKIIPGDDEVDAWPNLKAYFERVWNRNGENGCAQRAQPDGWHHRGKTNVWKGTVGNAKPLKKSVPRPSQPG